MIKYVYVAGDLQARSDTEFHYLARQRHLDWELDNPKINNENTIHFFLGDITEDSKPNSKELALLVRFYESLRCKEKWILGGNHDLNELKKTWSFDPLLELNGVKAFKKPEVVKVGMLSWLMLPYYKDSVFKDMKPMKEEYESYEGSYSFISHHFEDETMNFGTNNYIDISKIKGTRVGGHLHTGPEGYLPSPVPNTKAEMLDERYGLLINVDTWEIEKIIYPKNLAYVSIDYEEDIPKNILEEYPLIALTVNNVLDESKIREKYTNYENVHIRRLNTSSYMNKEEIKKEGKVRPLEEYWNIFKKERNVKPNVISLIEQKEVF
jgi:hypothetical protein